MNPIFSDLFPIITIRCGDKIKVKRNINRLMVACLRSARQIRPPETFALTADGGLLVFISFEKRNKNPGQLTGIDYEKDAQ